MLTILCQPKKKDTEPEPALKKKQPVQKEEEKAISEQTFGQQEPQNEENQVPNFDLKMWNEREQ